MIHKVSIIRADLNISVVNIFEVVNRWEVRVKVKIKDLNINILGRVLLILGILYNKSKQVKIDKSFNIYLWL